MIEKVRIVNFQSHADTTITLTSGVNVIVGPSDQGKSAVIRALLWVIQNKPDGLGFVSHWNMTDKGVLKAPTSVELEFDGHKIVRYRDRVANRYLVDGKVLEAVGRDVPEEIERLIDIKDINIQRQLDSHFLLSDSAGEVARILNRTIRLDDIDKLLALVEQKRRATKNTIEQVAEELQLIQVELGALAWIDAVVDILKEAQALEASIYKKTEIKSALYSTLQTYLNAKIEAQQINVEEIEKWVKKVIEEVQNMSGVRGMLRALQVQLQEFVQASALVVELTCIEFVQSLLTKVESLKNNIYNNKAEHRMLTTLLHDYMSAKELVTIIPALPESEIAEATEVAGEISVNRKVLRLLRESLTNYQQLQVQQRVIDDEIVKLDAMLPEVCPLCGGTGVLRGANV